MKANEIIPRQNRVVYVLLVVTAALALAWTLWRHTRPRADAAPRVRATALVR